MSAMPKGSLLSFFNARAEFLELNVIAGMAVGGQPFARMSKEVASSLQTHVKAVAGIPAEEANVLISKILETKLLDEHKRECVDAINDKVRLAYQEPKEGKAGQPCEHPEVWLTQKDWEKVMSSSTSIYERVICLTHRFCKAGLWYPTEPACRNIVALAYLGQGDAWSFMDSALASVHQFKAAVKAHRNSNVARGPLPKFVAGPTQFKADHEEWFVSAYGSEEPAQNIPIDVPSYNVLRMTIGCRNTKRGLAGGRLALAGGRLAPTQGKGIPLGAPSLSAPLTMQDLATFVSRQQMSLGMAGLPGFQVCSPPKLHLEMSPKKSAPSSSTTSLATSPTSAPLLALPAPEASSLSSPGAEASTPTKEGRGVVAVGPAANGHAAEACPVVAVGPATSGPAAEACPASDSVDLISKFQGMLHANKEGDDSTMLKRPAAAELVAAPKKPKITELVAVPKKPKITELVAVPKKPITKKPAGNRLELPDGFTQRKVQRKTGASAGHWDTYYFGPCGTMYRSLREVQLALDTSASAIG